VEKRVFVTGGAGLIGRRLIQKLIRKGCSVVAFDVGEQIGVCRPFFNEITGPGELKVVEGTILDRNGVAAVMRGADTVVHLAAMLGVQRTESNRLRCLEININGTENILNACVLTGVRHAIVASSSEVYGEPLGNPIKETDITQGKTVYAVSKLADEELAKGYAQTYPSLATTIVRFFNTYGEGQVAQFVLTRFVRDVLEGRAPVVYGTGEQVRGYAHVDDVTEGVCRIIDNPISHNQTYNLGNSKEVMTLTELARKVIAVLRPDAGLDVQVLGTFEGTDRSADREIHRRYCDASKARADLGFDPQIGIEEGIRRIAAQVKIQPNWPGAEE